MRFQRSGVSFPTCGCKTHCRGQKYHSCGVKMTCADASFTGAASKLTCAALQRFQGIMGMCEFFFECRTYVVSILGILTFRLMYSLYGHTS